MAENRRKTKPAEAPRLGPRPLPAHVGAAIATWMSSAAALPLWRNGSLPWRKDLAPQAASLAAAAAKIRPDDLAKALAAEIGNRVTAFQAGVGAYRDHPYRRTLDDPPVIWRAGTTRLLDYGMKGACGAPVFVVPSLVNRPWILDLSKDCSLLRNLAGRGLRPYLIDWDAPGKAERGYSLSDYVTKRLEPAFDAATKAAGGPVFIAGYCMGGLLALALALRRQSAARGLALLATPWDFHVDSPWPQPAIQPVLAGLAGLAAALGELPVDLLQLGFFAIDPLLAARKFSAFADRVERGAETEHYVAVEDWANDGVPLAAIVAQECLLGWYGANDPPAGRWKIGGVPVRPSEFVRPTLAILPRRDRLVPYASALALAQAIPSAVRLEPDLGHIGMVAGGRAPVQVWGPLADWLMKPDQARPT
ncbi:MAG: alpha/beta fold hydrolase [Alphaproteobacteria bacterium]